jgi:hypothetical protein
MTGCPEGAKQPPPILVSGTALGAERVRLVEEEKDLVLTATPAPLGSFTIAVAPGAASRPRILLEGPGDALVVTQPLSLDANVTLPPLRIWRAPVDVKRERDRLRFAWPRIPEGEGLPRSPRYSLLFSFRQRAGSEATHGEATLITRAPEAIQSLDDLADLIGERRPDDAKITLLIRCFDGDAPGSATWSGGPVEWEVPKDVPFRTKQVR